MPWTYGAHTSRGARPRAWHQLAITAARKGRFPGKGSSCSPSTSSPINMINIVCWRLLKSMSCRDATWFIQQMVTPLPGQDSALKTSEDSAIFVGHNWSHNMHNSNGAPGVVLTHDFKHRQRPDTTVNSQYTAMLFKLTKCSRLLKYFQTRSTHVQMFKSIFPLKNLAESRTLAILWLLSSQMLPR